MRIAILGSVALPVPPPFQGGTEWIAYHQAKGLSARGHQILLFGAEGTAANFANTDIRVIPVGKGNTVAGSSQQFVYDPTTMEASRMLRLEMVYVAQALAMLVQHVDDYDIILNNMRGEAIFLPMAKMLKKPFVMVTHLNIFPEFADFLQRYNSGIITISNYQREAFPALHYLGTAYNGVETAAYRFADSPEDYLLQVGTIGRHKNQAASINVAKKLGKKLVLIGKIRDADYFEELKKDIDGEQIIWKGEVAFAEKLAIYQKAKAFLFPILWEEPFGLVMIEAMSCGTPVIAFRKGAVPEVVSEAKTGFVVENEEAMIEAVKRIDQIDRKACRLHVEQNFTIEKMVDSYEQALLKVV